MHQRSIRNLILLRLGALLLLGMASGNYTLYLPFVSRMPTPTRTPTITATLTPTNTATAMPTPTLTPSATPSPMPPHTPNVGDPFWWWGGRSSTYQVWVNNLEMMCGAWICPDDNHNHLYNPSWVYIGEARGTATFSFPIEARDIMITWGEGDRFAFDALLGLVHGKQAAFGYTTEGIQSTHWFDGSNITGMTLVQHDYPYGLSPLPVA